MVPRFAVILLLVLATGLAKEIGKHKRDAEENLCSRFNPCGSGYPGGRRCEERINSNGRPFVECVQNRTNSCETMDCGEHGFCVLDCYNSYCRCENHYYGSRCENYQDPCEHMDCMNGGTCVVEDMPYGGWNTQCECPTGYAGYRCDQQLDQRDIYLTEGEEHVLQYPEALGGYQRPYSNNINIEWTVHMPTDAVGKEFVVEIGEGDYLETESCCDYLEIENANGESCGDYRGCITEGRLATVNTNTMRLIFHTDYSVVRRGFRVKISLIDAADDPCADNPCINGQICDSANGSCVHNPGFQTYSCSNNNFGYGTTPPYHNYPAGGYQTTTNIPYPTTDYIPWTTQPPPEPEVFDVMLTPGNTPYTIRVPDTASTNYQNNMNITWNLSTNVPNMEIVVTAEHFDTETYWDFLYFTSPSNSTRLDGVRDGQVLFTTSDQELVLNFRTDGSVTRSGFQINVDLI